MVKQGFGLNDTRTLYIDEFQSFYEESIYLLEKEGHIKEGSYEKMKGIDKTSENFSNMFAELKTKFKSE